MNKCTKDEMLELLKGLPPDTGVRYWEVDGVMRVEIYVPPEFGDDAFWSKNEALSAKTPLPDSTDLKH